MPTNGKDSYGVYRIKYWPRLWRSLCAKGHSEAFAMDHLRSLFTKKKNETNFGLNFVHKLTVENLSTRVIKRDNLSELP